MTLATHAVVGASLAVLAPNPLVGGVLAFASHFVLDAIPHWDYKLASARKDPNNSLNNDLILGLNFIGDLVKIGFDLLLGSVIALVVFGWWQGVDWHLLGAGILGATLPDFLQFAYMKMRWFSPLVWLQKFHITFMHSPWRLNDQPVLGILGQIVVIFVVVVLALLIKS